LEVAGEITGGSESFGEDPRSLGSICLWEHFRASPSHGKKSPRQKCIANDHATASLNLVLVIMLFRPEAGLPAIFTPIVPSRALFEARAT